MNIVDWLTRCLDQFQAVLDFMGWPPVNPPWDMATRLWCLGYWPAEAAHILAGIAKEGK